MGWDDVDWTGKVGMGVIVLIALAVIGGIGFAVWNEWRYPCLKSESYACTETYCAAYGPMSCGKNCTTTHCILYQTRPSTCTRFVLRGDRERMPAEVP